MTAWISIAERENIFAAWCEKYPGRHVSSRPCDDYGIWWNDARLSTHLERWHKLAVRHRVMCTRCETPFYRSMLREPGTLPPTVGVCDACLGGACLECNGYGVIVCEAAEFTNLSRRETGPTQSVQPCEQCNGTGRAPWASR
jgi:hypothetical protein